MTQVEFNDQFRNRTKQLSIEIIQWYSGLPRKSDEIRIMGKQLIRSVTSSAANFRAACRARSQAERFAKLCIVVEESDETLFWIELFQESGLVKVEQLESFHREALEILKVMAISRKNLKPN